jgi:hypothetical protein
MHSVSESETLPSGTGQCGSGSPTLDLTGHGGREHNMHSCCNFGDLATALRIKLIRKFDNCVIKLERRVIYMARHVALTKEYWPPLALLLCLVLR